MTLRDHWLCEACGLASLTGEPHCACSHHARYVVSPYSDDRLVWWALRITAKPPALRISIYKLADSYDRPRCHRAISAEALRHGRTYTHYPDDRGTITLC